jgi:hypothetical protein
MADTPARFKPVRRGTLARHQAAEYRMDLVLAGGQFPLQLDEVDRTTGMDQERLQAGRRGSGFQRFFQRNAQDLGQRSLQAGGLEQDMRVAIAQYPGHRDLLQRHHRIGVQNIRPRRRMDQLQGLSEEFDIDQSTGRIFQIPAIAPGILRGDLFPHIARVGQDKRAVARRGQTGGDFGFSGPATTLARVNARCSQVQLSRA